MDRISTDGLPTAEQAEDRDDPLYVQSVEKAFRVLDAFNSTHPTMSLSELARATGMPKSAAQRFAHTLCKLGYLHKDPRTRHMELTSRNLEHGFQFRQTNPLVGLATPYLLDLWRETGESISLSMLDDTDVVFIVRLMNRYSLATKIGSGMRAPAYCIAAGLSILSQMPREEASAVLHRSDIRSFTEKTQKDIPTILERLDTVKARGYVMCVGEYIDRDITIACPVMRNGKPVAAINLSTTIDRSTPEEAEEKYTNLVMGVSRILSSAQAYK
jgi:DNA-binding IclR family transcriptional regulator